MTTTITAPQRSARLALIAGGIVAVLFGAAVLVWPTKTAVVLTAIIAIYAIIAGVIYAGMGLFSKGLGFGGRLGHVILGVLYVVAGVFAFGELQQSAAFLALFLTLMLGVLWIIEGFASLFTIGSAGSKLFTVLFAIVSIVAGFTLVTSPLWGAVFLWWFLGVALVVLGVLNVFRGLFRRRS